MLSTNDGITYNEFAQNESGYFNPSSDGDIIPGVKGAIRGADQFQETWWGYNYGGTNNGNFAQINGNAGEKSRYFGNYNSATGNSNLQAAQFAAGDDTFMELSEGAMNRLQVNTAEEAVDTGNDGFIDPQHAKVTRYSSVPGWHSPPGPPFAVPLPSKNSTKETGGGVEEEGLRR